MATKQTRQPARRPAPSARHIVQKAIAQQVMETPVIKVQPAAIVEAPPLEGQITGIERPAMLEEYEFETAPTGLNPVVEFNAPGEFIFGEYLGERVLAISDRDQSMYDIRIDGSQVVSVWGSTILDRMIRQLDPQLGQMVSIQYLGDVPTKRGLTPAKNFEVAILKPKK